MSDPCCPLCGEELRITQTFNYCLNNYYHYEMHFKGKHIFKIIVTNEEMLLDIYHDRIDIFIFDKERDFPIKYSFPIENITIDKNIFSRMKKLLLYL